MKRRRLVLTVASIVLVILVGLFVIYGIPLIRDTFTPPISGLPTSASTTGNSLQARYTQTAQAKQAALTETPLHHNKGSLIV